jgi:hypothetical protein
VEEDKEREGSGGGGELVLLGQEEGVVAAGSDEDGGGDQEGIEHGDGHCQVGHVLELASLIAAMVEDKYIGLVLAVSGSLAIGTSFIITKMVSLHPSLPTPPLLILLSLDRVSTMQVNGGLIK